MLKIYIFSNHLLPRTGRKKYNENMNTAVFSCINFEPTSIKQTALNKCFHEHYLLDGQKKIYHLKIINIDQANTVTVFRQKEICCYRKFKTEAPFGLNEGESYGCIL